MALEPNTTVSHYKILSKIGKGGMGVVYLAQDTKLDRKVAIKFLPKDSSNDKDKLGRFVREAKSASALNHPGILTIYEIGEAEGSTYIASEYINGTDIGTYTNERKISLEKALDIAIQIVTALKAAHDSGIVHRDIKPENVMIREDGIIKILDFGLAKLLEKDRDGTVKRSGPDSETMIAGTRDGPKTSPGMVMGTVNYMSPEQARGRDVGHRSDIFSFGALLYEILTRKRAFDGDSTNDAIAALLMKDPVPIRELNPEIPLRLQEIVERCLRKDKKERFASSKELLDELTRLKRHLQIEEIEKTILPEEEHRETKMFPATTADAAGQTTRARTGEGDSIMIRKSLAGKIAIAALAVLIAGVAGYFVWSFAYASNQRIESIAVVPFVNESGDAELEYLSDGMTETLINDLSEIPDLKVKARSSVFRFKGSEKSPSAIAEELGVEAVLIGRLVKRDDQISLSLELINAETENILWGHKYENSVSELASLQKRIAGDVAAELAAKLTGQSGESSASESSEAYQAYLKGRFHWNKRTLDGFEKAIEFFEEAIKFDPNYARAWSGLADSYLLLPEYGDYRPIEYLPKAKQAAEKALELDPGSAEATTSLAYILYAYDWDFERAEELYKKSIGLDPEYATTYQWYAELLHNLKRLKEAEANARKSVELDPLAPIKGKVLGQILLTEGDLSAAEEQLKRTLEVDSEFGPSLEALVLTYSLQNRVNEALATCDRLESVYRGAYDYCYGSVYAHTGQRQKAQDFLSSYEYSGSIQAYNVALINARIGRSDRAFEILDQLYKEKHVFLLGITIDPGFAGVRDDPRYKELLAKLGLPE